VNSTERSSQIRWVRAGHDPALIYDPPNGTFDELKGDGIPLGLDDTIAYESYERHIKPGQIIVIGTDGIWEAHNGAGEMFGKKAFMEIIRENHTAPSQQIVDTVMEELERFRGNGAREDDITLVVIKMEG
jgi:sigma-B regulation protein RsbU (phosphoserine phosphatase)